MPRTNRYRGRRGVSRAFAALGVTILIITVLSGTAYLFLRPYFTVTEQGLLIELPFWQGGLFMGNTPEPNVEPPDEIKMIIETTPSAGPPSAGPPSTGQQSGETPVTEQLPDAKPVSGQIPESETSLRAVFLPQTALGKAQEIAALCESGLVNTVVLELKTTDGAIVTGKPELLDAINTLKDKAALVGYLSLLLDNSATRNHADFALKHTSGVNWLDQDRARWLNPFVPQVQDWIALQVEAAAALPLDILLLDNLSFPVSGRQNLISWGEYDPAERVAAISELAAKLTQTAGIPCWAVLQADVCTGQQPGTDNAAQDAAVFEELFERLFVKLPQEQTVEFYEAVQANSDGKAPLPIIQIPTEGLPTAGLPTAGLPTASLEGYIMVDPSGDYSTLR